MPSPWASARNGAWRRWFGVYTIMNRRLLSGSGYHRLLYMLVSSGVRERVFGTSLMQSIYSNTYFTLTVHILFVLGVSSDLTGTIKGVFQEKRGHWWMSDHTNSFKKVQKRRVHVAEMYFNEERLEALRCMSWKQEVESKMSYLQQCHIFITLPCKRLSKWLVHNATMSRT